MAATRSVRLSKKANSELAKAVQPDGKFSAVAPNQQMYGIYGPQYAALMAQPSGSASLDAFRESSLMTNAGLEQRAYERQLAEANRVQKELQGRDAYYGILKDREGYLQGDVDRGMGGVRAEVAYDPNTQTPVILDNPANEVMLRNANANVLNNDQAERVGTYGVFAKNMSDAGFAVPKEYLGQMITPQTQAEPVKVENYMNPGDVTTRYAADEGLSKQEQFRMAEINRAAKENGDEVEGALTIGANGVAQVVYKGSPEALAKYGIDPATGRPLNPNAGANSGTAPAQPTAAPKPHKVSASPIANGRKVAETVYPGVRVTENRRDPNSPLGKANPNSWHNRSGGAIDVAPIKGMTFEQYINGYRQKGYEIIEAKNEVGKGRSKHATGDHWHVVLGKPVDTSTVYANRLKAHPNVATVQAAGDGQLLVTLKNGEKRVYKNGVRVG